MDAEPLSPSVQSFTYRQKAQRAFASELLCPRHALAGPLGDKAYVQRLAAKFSVPEAAVELGAAARSDLEQPPQESNPHLLVQSQVFCH